MARRLLTLLSALSLLLCVVTVAQWVRSYWRMAIWQWTWTDGFLTVTTSRGVWLVRGGTVTWSGWTTMAHGFSRPGSRYALDLTSDPIYPGPRLGSWAAFGQVTGRDPGVAWWRVYLPHWIIPVAASVLPLRWWVLYRGRWRGERRWGRGHCPSCGYDLRATPGRCPECGAAAPQPPPSPAAPRESGPPPPPAPAPLDAASN